MKDAPHHCHGVKKGSLAHSSQSASKRFSKAQQAGIQCSRELVKACRLKTHRFGCGHAARMQLRTQPSAAAVDLDGQVERAIMDTRAVHKQCSLHSKR
eukprot:1141211-Pelagomonas_calceolata.AAC.3